MAISENERDAVQKYYELAFEEGRLTKEIDAPQEIDVLYPYGDGACVLRIQKEQGEKKTIELWACDLRLVDGQGWQVRDAIQVGIQDPLGRITWMLK